MKSFKCHKVVQAARIKSIETFEQSTVIHFFDPKDDMVVSPDWLAKVKPQPGGYVVNYEDGYTSYSPRKAFEDGYTEIVKL